MEKDYTAVNSETISRWTLSGWEWGKPVNHETYEKALAGEWEVLLTPTRFVPHEWFGDLQGKKVLGLASAGGQQMPVFTALGAECTVLDYSKAQLENERTVAEREGYSINIVHADMTKPLPFENGTFDLIFHPVSNCYIEDVVPVWKECFRVLKSGGILLAGFDNGVIYAFDDDETAPVIKLPYNPLKDEELYKEAIENDWGIQFSHTIDEQIGGQLKSGFILEDIYEDTFNVGNLGLHNVPLFYATKARKPE